MDNIAEGFGDMSRKEFIKFLGYSLRSCSEVQSQLHRALDCQYISKEDFKEIYQMAGDCRGQIKAFRGYLKTEK
jgi:four helix bundle protein